MINQYANNSKLYFPYSLVCNVIKQVFFSSEWTPNPSGELEHHQSAGP